MHRQYLHGELHIVNEDASVEKNIFSSCKTIRNEDTSVCTFKQNYSNHLRADFALKYPTLKEFVFFIQLEVCSNSICECTV